MSNRSALILSPFAVILLIVLACTGQSRVTKDAMRKARHEFNWPKFLAAVEQADTPAAVLEQAGPRALKISRRMLEHVNNYSGTPFTMVEVTGNRNLARWCCILYLRLRGADGDYERAALAWGKAARQMSPSEAKIYWKDQVRPKMLALMRGPGG